MNLMVVSKLLAETKIQIDTASNGAECLRLTQNHHYALLTAWRSHRTARVTEPSLVYFTALLSRLIKICLMRTSSPQSMLRSPAGGADGRRDQRQQRLHQGLEVHRDPGPLPIEELVVAARVGGQRHHGDILAQAARLGPYRQSFEAPDAHILVVDDNDMNLMVVSKLLAETKIQIDTERCSVPARFPRCSGSSPRPPAGRR